jgi:tRNA-splicing ligase RtcB
LPDPFGRTGQPVLVRGGMGASSYVLAGLDSSEALAFSSACRGPLGGTPGAGRDVDAVVMATEQAGLAQRVARLEPLISIP